MYTALKGFTASGTCEGDPGFRTIGRECFHGFAGVMSDCCGLPRALGNSATDADVRGNTDLHTDDHFTERVIHYGRH